MRVVYLSKDKSYSSILNRGQLDVKKLNVLFIVLGRVVQSRVKITRGAKFEFRYESLKSKSTFILFAYNLMIGCSIKNRENYRGNCF